MAETTSALFNAQYQAVGATPGGDQVPVVLDLDYSGPCSLGGSVTVTGRYATGADGGFSNDFTMDACRDELGTLDGFAHEAATTTGSASAMTITGNLVFSASDGGGADCEYNLVAAVDLTTKSATYTGTVCGYDVTPWFAD